MLGATLIDAQDELVAAWTTLDRQGPNAPSAARAWLTESPPWPPASVERLQKRGGEDALTLVEDLAGQIAPDPAVRLALLQSWLRPRRQIDDASARGAIRAAEGRLAREPRFRSWLRGMDGLGAPALSTSRSPGIDCGVCLGCRALTTNPSLNSLTRSGFTMIRVIIEGLVKRYGQVAAVDDASLEIAPGELACVLGPPGAGKTTLGRLLAGLEVARRRRDLLGRPHGPDTCAARAPGGHGLPRLRPLAGHDGGRQRGLSAQDPGSEGT